MSEKDLRLLAAVFRAAREVAESDPELQRALDEFDLRASLRVPA
jgi:hypothetical protein